jgi:putative ABC transport system substrate-binding protein
VLVNPNNPTTASISTDIQAAASAIGQQIEVLTATTNREIDTAFASLVQKGAAAVIVSPDAFFNNRRIQLISLALRHGLPAIYPRREYADAGGLMSYGSRGTEQYRLVGIYTGRILKGEKPADLPVMQPTKFEFVINQQTARIIGIEVPPTLLALADEVIE